MATVYRGSVWFIKGLREYTKNGFLAAEKHFVPGALDTDISQRSFMITGANSGIGKETALALAKKGATVHMVCRNETRGNEAKTEIIETSGNQNIFLHILDMSNPCKIVEFVNGFAESGRELHVLVNNAGCMINAREVTEDGFEKNFATNTLGTFILTTQLLPVLEKSESPRVIVVSSGGMLTVKLNVKDLQFEQMDPFDGTTAYAQNKRQQVVMTRKWAEQHPNVYFASMHPGWADTPAVKLSMPDFHRRMKNSLRTPAQGADTLIWLCIAQDVSDSGSFFQDRKAVATHLPLAWSKSSPEEDRKLMETLLGMSKKFTEKS